ncbi:hypothetical protein [Nonomuraea sp. NPDC050643]|uniref:hypothetical protein n=1 Tax=Nonomuraea sp. NPDC050643 TaxID=3155660 RepID=UPI003409D32A
MHLAEMAVLRAVPAAGVFLALTRRCPLSCAHCSTESAMDSAEHADRPFRRLVASFTGAERPEFIAMSGGEALLRPRLVRDLADSARLSGAKSYLLSGLYFARDGHAVPPALRAAISAVDHFAVSLDRFHEREVSRHAAFRVLREVRSWGPQVSVQITGDGDADPYVAELVDEVRREFADQVPMLVVPLRPVGRARSLGGPDGPHVRQAAPAPCEMAAWPLVTYDGTVLTCCNDNLVAATRPPHLVLGHADHDPWSVLRRRHLDRPLTRAIRMFGPRYTKDRFGSDAGPPAPGYCEVCVNLHRDPGLGDRVAGYLDSPAGPAMESAVRGLVEGHGPHVFARRHGIARYSELVTLGWQGRERSCAG